jgi:hypothetical protein
MLLCPVRLRKEAAEVLMTIDSLYIGAPSDGHGGGLVVTVYLPSRKVNELGKWGAYGKPDWTYGDVSTSGAFWNKELTNRTARVKFNPPVKEFQVGVILVDPWLSASTTVQLKGLSFLPIK